MNDILNKILSEKTPEEFAAEVVIVRKKIGSDNKYDISAEELIGIKPRTRIIMPKEECPDIPIGTKVIVYSGVRKPHYAHQVSGRFSGWTYYGDMSISDDGRTCLPTFAGHTGRDWNYWEIDEGEHKGKKNFKQGEIKMTIKQNKPEPVVFDTPEDLLIAMIRGRHLELNGCTYSFSKELSSFMYIYDGSGIVYPHGIGESKEVVTDISLICEVLVGKKLKEVDPIHIEVDTLLCVLDCPIVKGSTSITPQLNYFSHWSEGRLYCFADGTTSLTATKTKSWRYWEFAKEAVCLAQN